MVHEFSRSMSFGLWIPDTSIDGEEDKKKLRFIVMMRLIVSHPFKAFFYRIWCVSANSPLGGAVAPWLNFLLICHLSPASVLHSQGWPQTPSSSPVNNHTNKHER